MKRLAIVPALNEADSIAAVVREVRAADPGFEVLVVDDGSTDATAGRAAAAGARVLRLPYNLGIGGAVQAGYRYARDRGFEVAVQVDGDGQHDPAALPALIAPVIAGEADLVVGSRFAAAGSFPVSRPRRAAMRLFAVVVSLVAGQRLTDTSSAFRAVNRRGIELFAEDYPDGFLETVEATALAARHRLRIRELPVAMRLRAHGASSLTTPRSLWYAAAVLVAIVAGLFRRAPARV